VSLRNLARLLPNPSDKVEIVVCDNTSSDHTPQVIQPYLHRPDFHYYRNPQNVGMLGNLRVTAHQARGRYVWILGDDDLVKPGSIEKVLEVIQEHPAISLVYLNYGYTREDNPEAAADLDKFLNESTPIVAPNKDIFGTVSQICTESENFFTAIYCLVFRRDHALRAYTQNTEGRPFSTMLTCIPTTYYTLNFMMNESAYWVGEPQLVVNLNVSWMKYAPLWILERIPEVYDLAERLGADPQAVDRWRMHTLQGVVQWFRSIYENDSEGNIKYFSPSRLVARMKHLDTFSGYVQELQAIYESAHMLGHPGAQIPPSQVFSISASQQRNLK
jgi:glycosyltransferase involved in cell wall biosynthesis